jgi:CRP-like cAMP-binding protein
LLTQYGTAFQLGGCQDELGYCDVQPGGTAIVLILRVFYGSPSDTAQTAQARVAYRGPPAGDDALHRASFLEHRGNRPGTPNTRLFAVDAERVRITKQNFLLAALPSQDFALLEPHLREAALAQGSLLQEQGERTDHIYFPNDGIISLLTVMRQGTAIETATIGREGAFGAWAGLGTRPSHARAVVQVTGTAWRIAAPQFRAAAKKSDAVRELIRTSGEMLLIQAQQTAACNALHDVESRLSRWLLQAHDRLDSDTIQLTHEFLAQMLGVRRTTVTVIANILQHAGLIRYQRGNIRIVDRAGLEARACECYEAIRRNISGIGSGAES